MEDTQPFYYDIGKFNKSYFNYVAAFGAFTQVSYTTSQEMKNQLGDAEDALGQFGEEMKDVSGDTDDAVQTVFSLNDAFKSIGDIVSGIGSSISGIFDSTVDTMKEMVDEMFSLMGEAWAAADIVVANHALFFTDLKMQLESGDYSGGLLPDYGAVVIDEAHTLEDNAADHLGLHLTYGGFKAFLNRLYNPDTARGLLMRPGTGSLELRSQVAGLKSLAKDFFGQFQEYLQQGNDSIRSIERPGIFSNFLQSPLMDFRCALGDYTREQSDADFRSELESLVQQCDAYIDEFHTFVNMTRPESVYWVEDDSRQLVLQTAPLNVAEILSEDLFGREFPVITTSATLTVDRRFNYFIARTGFTGGITRQLSSPFDPQKVKLYVGNSMPDPSSEAYENALFKALERYISLSDGKAFVLFTSYSLLRKAADALEGFLFHNRIKLLMQGGDMSRSMLLNEFKKDVRSVLFGTDSFWTGVDVPGESLSNVIITKLPFSVPTHPLMQARSERIKLQGGNAFFDYSLPEAVLKLRQGAGRLIRSSSDSGMIVILDSRLTTKRYGRTFLNSLPPYPRINN